MELSLRKSKPQLTMYLIINRTQRRVTSLLTENLIHCQSVHAIALSYNPQIIFMFQSHQPSYLRYVCDDNQHFNLSICTSLVALFLTFSTSSINYCHFALGGVKSIVMSMHVCSSVCSHNLKTTRPNFTKCFVCVACGSVFL